jgi:protocatechuate 3,4-dioxygenase beta subunit
MMADWEQVRQEKNMKRQTISLRRRNLMVASLVGVATPASVFAAQCTGGLNKTADVVSLNTDMAGRKLVVSGRILGADCKPLSGATVEAWHVYAHGDKAIATTDADGRFMFTTTAPSARAATVPQLGYRVSHNGHDLTQNQLYFTRQTEVADERISQLQRDDSGVWRATFGLTVA